MKKYELTSETKIVFGKTLYRIKALISFKYAEKGEKGGFMESENNLSHGGNAWVSDDAWVFGNACVSGDALVARLRLINIIGLNVNVTISDFHIQLGCVIKKITEWETLSDEWVKENYSEYLEWWKNHKDIILTLAKNRTV